MYHLKLYLRRPDNVLLASLKNKQPVIISALKQSILKLVLVDYVSQTTFATQTDVDR